MSDILLIVVLFIAGLATVALEILLPSFGLLTLVAVGFLIAANWQLWQLNETAGMVGIALSLVGTPAFAWWAIRMLPHTAIGRHLIPQTPLSEPGEAHPQSEAYLALAGQQGEAATDLRPVGMCRINGQRIECQSEAGLIDKGQPVRVVRVQGASVFVAALESDPT